MKIIEVSHIFTEASYGLLSAQRYFCCKPCCGMFKHVYSFNLFDLFYNPSYTCKWTFICNFYFIISYQTLKSCYTEASYCLLRVVTIFFTEASIDCSVHWGILVAIDVWYYFYEVHWMFIIFHLIRNLSVMLCFIISYRTLQS